MQEWTLELDGRTHRVHSEGSARHTVTWWVDDVEVARKTSMDETITLSADGTGDPDGAGVGSVVVKHSHLGAPRRATLHPEGGSGALTGVGGTDLEPAPGSPAATWEQRVRDHPRRHALIATLGATAGVVLPILLALLLARWALPQIPFPDLPDLPDLPGIPLPDLPDIPWPNLPSIPWPDWSLPGWLRWLLDQAGLVVPILIAYAVARGEIRRRRRQDEERAARRTRDQIAHEAAEDGDDRPSAEG